MFGKVGKEMNPPIDLREAIVTRDKKSRKVFKIKHPQTKLTLKAANEEEREKWVNTLTKVAKSFAGEDVSKRSKENASDSK